jgi:hypothetical protein
MSIYLAQDAELIRRLLLRTATPPGDDDGLFLGYAVLMRAKGTQSTASDVHDVWSAWMLARDPHHQSLVPFEELSADVQDMDNPYVVAIHAAAKRRATLRNSA